MSLFNKHELSEQETDAYIRSLLNRDDPDKMKTLLKSFNLGRFIFSLHEPHRESRYCTSYTGRKKVMEVYILGYVNSHEIAYKNEFGTFRSFSNLSQLEQIVTIAIAPSSYGLYSLFSDTETKQFKALNSKVRTIREEIEKEKKLKTDAEAINFTNSVINNIPPIRIPTITMTEEEYGPWLFISLPINDHIGNDYLSRIERPLVLDDILEIKNNTVRILHYGLGRTEVVKYNYKGVYDSVGHLLTKGEEGLKDCEGYRVLKKAVEKLDLEYKTLCLNKLEKEITDVLLNRTTASSLAYVDSDKDRFEAKTLPLHDIRKKAESLRIDRYIISDYSGDSLSRRNDYIALAKSNYEKINQYAEVLAKDNRRRQLLNNKLEEESQKRKSDFEAIAALKKIYKSLSCNNTPSKNELESLIQELLINSRYPLSFKKTVISDFNIDSEMLVVEYFLPSKSVIPKEKGFKIDSITGKVVQTDKTQKTIDDSWTNLVYSIALRSISECYCADTFGLIKGIVFNGWVNELNPGTGKVETSCILSLKTDRESFLAIDLDHVDPIMCFRNLKGVSCAKLATITPVVPILSVQKDDRRFVSSRNVVDSLDESTNLATMDWQDFEHLIRDLFGKIFNSNGSEVRITQASRDGGVDAIAFDSDPIRGGKIVIQAKRYTNVVGVSAVRDLYGTVMNEGAMKGILVTTSSFGSDSYDFAKDKPLTLLSGGNLLALLEQYGYHAKIDIAEARRLMGSS